MLDLPRPGLTPLTLFATTLFLTSAIAQQPTVGHAETKLVWIWSSQCKSSYKVGLVVHFRGKALYRRSLQVCRGPREAEDGKVAFRFSGQYVFLGDSGEYHTAPSDTIEADIWQAGGEHDALILGLSLATEKQILLDSLYVADPTKRNTSALGEGVVVDTYPLWIHQRPR